MNSEDKKKLKAQYNLRTVVGGVYAIRNTVTGKILLDRSQDISGIRNRFDFAKMTGTALSPKIRNDWELYGPDSFVFEVLEKLEKKETQDSGDFSGDLEILEEIWRDKLISEEFY